MQKRFKHLAGLVLVTLLLTGCGVLGVLMAKDSLFTAQQRPASLLLSAESTPSPSETQSPSPSPSRLSEPEPTTTPSQESRSQERDYISQLEQNKTVCESNCQSNGSREAAYWGLPGQYTSPSCLARCQSDYEESLAHYKQTGTTYTPYYPGVSTPKEDTTTTILGCRESYPNLGSEWLACQKRVLQRQLDAIRQSKN